MLSEKVKIASSYFDFSHAISYKYLKCYFLRLFIFFEISII